MKDTHKRHRCFRLRRIARVFATVCFLAIPVLAGAQEPSIERLLKKLPAPEKLVKPQVKRAIEKPDTAVKDPLAKQTISALNSEPLRALTLSRELVHKNPSSPFAHFLHGVAAMDIRQFGEASGAFRSSISIRSDIPIVHLALGVTEMVQNHFALGPAPFRTSRETRT